MEENFTRICYQAELVSIRPNMLGEFRSRRSTLLESMVLLKDEDVSWIRVHPMTGMERSTLDETVWSVVSHVSAVSKIQEEIASALGFRLSHEETQQIRPDEIYEMLRRSTMKKVVITFDDARSSFDLLSIGFLDRDRGVACKVLLTSRDIIQSRRNADFEMSIIPVTILPKEDAFLLFNWIVGQTEYTDLVEKIVDTCSGMPLAIEVVAQKLKGRPLSEWEHTKSEFDCSMPSNIKLSYDYMGWERYKFMFLLCSILGQQIFYEDLIKYGSSLIFEKVLGLKEAKEWVYKQTRFLKQKKLLLDGKIGEYLSMSKICRDVAMAVATSDPDWFIVRKDSRVIEWPKNDILAKVRYISLQVSSGTLELPEGLVLPELKLLYVYDEDGSLKVADNFFIRMNKAGPKVLALIKMQLLSLPSSLLDLINIDTLCLDYCVLGDISMIGELQTLRVLSLSHTNIEQLPKEIGQLTILCLLDLSNCLNLKVIPPNVLSSLTKLEYLLMRNSFADWRIGNTYYGRDRPSLDELTSLTRLCFLDIHILNPYMIPKGLPWGKWDRYNIVIGQDFQCPLEEHKTSRVLKWNHNNSLNDWIKIPLKNFHELCLRKSKSLEKVLLKGQHLKHIYIQDNAEMEYLIRQGAASPVVFPYLRSLVLKNLINFKALIDNSIDSVLSFGFLMMLRIEDCLSLRFVFKISSRECLLNLRELEVSGCENMEAIFINNNQQEPQSFDFMSLNGLQSLTLQNLDKLVIFLSFTDSSDHDHVRPLLHKVDLPDLKHLKLVKIPEVKHVVVADTTNGLLTLQNLESLEINDCHKLYQLFNFESLVDIHEDYGGLLPKLRQLRLQNLDNFDCFIGDKHLQRRILSFKMLNQLKICNCNQLRYLLPHYVLQNLKLLQKIDIKDCPMLKQVFLNEEDTVMIESIKPVLPLLHSLKLSNLPKLENFCSGALPLLILHLNQVTIEDCPKLIFTFAHSHTTSITNSKEIIIMPSPPLNLNLRTQVKKMWNDHLLHFRHLISLQLYGFDNWEYLFSSLVAQSLSSLQELKIISCNIQTVIGESKVTAIAGTVEFPQVATLILEKLPRFTKFCHNNCTVKWLSLKKLRVVECHDIEESALGVVDKTLLRSMEVIDCSPWENEDPAINVTYLFKYTPTNLTIKDSDDLKEYITMQSLLLSLTKLKTLVATRCNNELNKLLSILLRSSRKLERLTVEKCEVLEQVFDLGGFDPEGNGGFPNLNTIILSDLPNLNFIWNKDPIGIIDLRRLVKLEIIKCGSLRNLVSIAVVENLVLLEELYFDSCEMIEEVATNKVGEETENQGRWFPNLKNLHLMNLPNFLKFNLQNLSFRFPNLLSLTIEHCPKMKAFTTGFLNAKAPDPFGPMKNKIVDAYPELQSLNLIGLKTYEIWQGCISTESFCELKELELGDLSNVEYIFSSSMLPRLEKLKKLIVRNCSSLSNVFQLIGNNSIMYAQNLEIIQLKGCDSLSHLQLLPFTKLKEVEICECGILEEIFMEIGEQVIDAKILPHLESIVLEKLPMLPSSSLEAVEFPSLVKVRIADCPMLNTFKPRPTRNATDKLKNINNENSQLDVAELELLPLLDELVLSDLPRMQLWEQEPEIPVFRNLTLLEIIRCNSIQKLFSIAVAENVHALKMLKIYGCQNLVQVLQGGGGNSKKVFQKLECLILKHLPNLTSFCEQDFEFEFPQLQMIRVEGIPKMKTFVKGSLKTSKLKTVYVIFIKKFWQGNLNTTIKYLNGNQEELKAKVDGGSLLTYQNAPVNDFRLSTIAAQSSSEKKHSATMSWSSEDSYNSSSSHGQ